MPLYEYRCSACGEPFEEYRSVAERDRAGTCPKCGSADTARGVASLLRGGASSKGASCSPDGFT